MATSESQVCAGRHAVLNQQPCRRPGILPAPTFLQNLQVGLRGVKYPSSKITLEDLDLAEDVPYPSVPQRRTDQASNAVRCDHEVSARSAPAVAGLK